MPTAACLVSSSQGKTNGTLLPSVNYHTASDILTLCLTFGPGSVIKASLRKSSLPLEVYGCHAAVPGCGCRKTVMRSLIKVNGCQIHGRCVHCPLLSRYYTLLHTVFYCVVFFRGGCRVNLKRVNSSTPAVHPAVQYQTRAGVSYPSGYHSQFLLMSIFSVSPFFLSFTHTHFSM